MHAFWGTELNSQVLNLTFVAASEISVKMWVYKVLQQVALLSDSQQIRSCLYGLLGSSTLTGPFYSAHHFPSGITLY